MRYERIFKNKKIIALFIILMLLGLSWTLRPQVISPSVKTEYFTVERDGGLIVVEAKGEHILLINDKEVNSFKDSIKLNVKDLPEGDVKFGVKKIQNIGFAKLVSNKSQDKNFKIVNQIPKFEILNKLDKYYIQTVPLLEAKTDITAGYLYVNGKEVKKINKTFTIPLEVNDGKNAYKIQVKDTFGNESLVKDVEFTVLKKPGLSVKQCSYLDLPYDSTRLQFGLLQPDNLMGYTYDQVDGIECDGKSIAALIQPIGSKYKCLSCDLGIDEYLIIGNSYDFYSKSKSTSSEFIKLITTPYEDEKLSIIEKKDYTTAYGGIDGTLLEIKKEHIEDPNRYYNGPTEEHILIFVFDHEGTATHIKANRFEIDAQRRKDFMELVDTFKVNSMQ